MRRVSGVPAREDGAMQPPVVRRPGAPRVAWPVDRPA